MFLTSTENCVLQEVHIRRRIRVSYTLAFLSVQDEVVSCITKTEHTLTYKLHIVATVSSG